jgi:hypothetical protein
VCCLARFHGFSDRLPVGIGYAVTGQWIASIVSGGDPKSRTVQAKRIAVACGDADDGTLAMGASVADGLHVHESKSGAVATTVAKYALAIDDFEVIIVDVVVMFHVISLQTL